ncbi:hypothetical protein L202_01109 [Cryptococcus amylolentus CBS 6039]|uniref:Dystroglycan-type cadherin-like domain-containing protein n=1 Tax=Cryptococcus amylolentus CBS 6039 TaxID=1295533 RepID=A0A1E3I2W2_9TREE|nr:hypothetical protein L202_01109 [Cryptococcus amylolentus CBS 6039]ODN82848.1 hypothetical protein L202_01109 [Cryptococcus amylolentus CBS 6039]
MPASPFSTILIAALLWGVLFGKSVQAGYLSVNMTQAVQCERATVQWEGDDGPYHLLLTPTEIKQHGYNVWIESIPAGTHEYTFTIKQPAGLQFMLTMWGASGISYAATTDVMTVGTSSTGDSSCFLSDDQILDLYSFSFTLDTANNDTYPAQCSNISLSWPTSLESNVTSDVAKRDLAGLDKMAERDSSVELEELALSSSDHSGNTTSPPTLFGVIPLGNSFSIPITYANTSKFASSLPASSLSDNPTTRTSQGTTYLDWTVDMAKGTRFLLVAGIGSEQKWASGGSSKMFTVGQGSTGCVGSEQGSDGAPSVTASDGTATATTTVPVNPGGSNGSELSPTVRTVVAAICSILGTLVIVGLVFFCRRRMRNKRDADAVVTAGQPSTGSSGGGGKLFGMFAKRGSSPKAVNRTTAADTQLDLIASRTSVARQRELTPLVAHDLAPTVSPSTASPQDALDPFVDQQTPNSSMSHKHPYPPTPSSQSAYDPGFAGLGAGRALNGGRQPSPVTPITPVGGEGMGRTSSMDALLPAGSVYHDPPTRGHDAGLDSGGSAGEASLPSRPDSGGYATESYYRPYMRQQSGPLVLHDPTTRDVDASTEGGEDSEDVTDLKRDTLATTGQRPQIRLRTAQSRQGSAGSGPPSATARRRRREEQEMEFMVHRDAGRVVAPDSGNVLELPPRYEEVQWTEEERREREERELERERAREQREREERGTR